METNKTLILHKLQALRLSQLKTVILGVSGSVATIKAKEIAEKLLTDLKVNVVLVPTSNASHFTQLPLYSPSCLSESYPLSSDATTPMFVTFTDQEEWTAWTQREDPVLHIELRRLAHVLLIAPLSANTLAKLANGMCDNLLTSVFRCWDFKKPVIVAPAMNTMMYEHPFTEKQLAVLGKELGVNVLDTAFKKLMCGDEGYGALIDTETIVDAVRQGIK